MFQDPGFNGIEMNMRQEPEVIERVKFDEKMSVNSDDVIRPRGLS